jgi:plastocyanin
VGTATPVPTARATPVPTASVTPRPTVAPTPRPTRTPRPATPRPATPPPTTAGAAVHISNFAFTPATITVAVGARVTWTNQQPDIQHTVTADDGSFGSNPLSTGSSFSHVFTIAGTYTYHCNIHPDMTGTVIVTG